MTITEFANMAIDQYVEENGSIDPNITLRVFQMIEKDETLMSFYNNLVSKSSSHAVNATIGKTIKRHFNLTPRGKASAYGLCGLIVNYTKLY